MPRHRSTPPAAVVALLLSLAVLGGCAPVDARVGGTPAARPPEVTPAATEITAPTARPTPLSTPIPSPTPRPSPTPAPPTEAFALNLYEPGDYVAQYTFEWCVGASIQMTLNMVDGRGDRSRALQQELWELARDLSNSPFGGASPIGWTEALNRVGVGPYRLTSVPDLDGALRTAAAALRQTNRPVGLVMWSGRHAWMMSGFTSLGDPATAPNFELTGIRVLDPLHPHGSRQWGPSPEPNALVSVETVGRQFVARLGGRVPLGVAPGYLLILPVPAA